MSKSVGFLGTGRIAEPMVRSLARQFPDMHIRISERNADIAARLVQLDNVEAVDNQQLISASDTVIICLLANVAREVLPGLQFDKEQSIISVMADISLDEISNLIVPAMNPCVTIPLPFIEQGGCPLPVYPISQELEGLFGKENTIITQSMESAMGPHFAATAILSSTMNQLQTVAQWLGEKAGSSKDAERYVASLVAGYLGVMEKDGNGRFIEAMEDLSTEGGLNNQLRAHITATGHYDLLAQGLEQLNERLIRNSSND